MMIAKNYGKVMYTNDDDDISWLNEQASQSQLPLRFRCRFFAVSIAVTATVVESSMTLAATVNCRNLSAPAI